MQLDAPYTDTHTPLIAEVHAEGNMLDKTFLDKEFPIPQGGERFANSWQMLRLKPSRGRGGGIETEVMVQEDGPEEVTFMQRP